MRDYLLSFINERQYLDIAALLPFYCTSVKKQNQFSPQCLIGKKEPENWTLNLK